MAEVACPICGMKVVWNPANKYRPFCSERCKNLDLGAWAAERYGIPVQESSDQSEGGEDRPTPYP